MPSNRNGEPGRSLGYGFVCFTTQEAANKAIADMNKAIIKTKPLFVCHAQRKVDRQAMLRYNAFIRYPGVTFEVRL